MMRARVAAQNPCNQALTNNNNKVVVGSSFWNMPKYMGKGVVLCGPLGESGMSSGSKGMQFHDFWQKHAMTHLKCATFNAHQEL